MIAFERYFLSGGMQAHTKVIIRSSVPHLGIPKMPDNHVNTSSICNNILFQALYKDKYSLLGGH